MSNGDTGKILKGFHPSKKIVRQDRMSVAGENCFIECLGRKLEVIDCSTFGLAVVSEDPLEQLNDILGVAIHFNEQFLGEFNLRRVRSEQTESGQFKIAFECLGEPVPIERIRAIRIAKLMIIEHRDEQCSSAEIPESFKRIVYEMKDWLLSLKTRVNSLGPHFEKLSPKEADDFERAVSTIVGNYIVQEFGPTYKQLERSLGNPTSELTKKAFDFFRLKLSELLQHAPFSKRANQKPRGYSGDYQMMNYIYWAQPYGDDLFSKCLHSYFVYAPESRAVRNRATYLEKKILDCIEGRTEQVHILSVAAGPAFEIQKLVRENFRVIDFSKIHFHLLDQDLEALQFAQREMRAVAREIGININIELINQNIKNLIGQGLGNRKFDLIYSAGLFDYFSDPVAAIAAQKLVSHLEFGGKLVIGNFSVSSPGQITMDLALDWHLIYRSESDLRKLYSHLAPKLEIEHEEEGINLFCVLTKSS